MEIAESLSYSFQRRGPLIHQVAEVGFDLYLLFITSSPFLCTLWLDGEDRHRKPILMSLDHQCSPDSAGREDRNTLRYHFSSNHVSLLNWGFPRATHLISQIPKPQQF